MSSFLNYLNRHPFLNLLLLIVYYPLVVLPHEEVGRFCAWLFDEHMTRDDYNTIILITSLAGLSGYVYFLLKNTRGNSHLRRQIFFYGTVTVLCSILCFKLLIVINIEVVHFVQYGIMAILMFPLVRRYGETVLWVTLAGAFDEAWQYFYLAPVKSNYYDFNDVIINLLGSVYGLLLVRSLQPSFALPRRLHFWRSPVFYVLLTLTGMIALSLWRGWIHLNAPASGDGALWSLIRVPQNGFWTTVHPQVTFHVVQPLEGLAVIGLLWLFYSGLGKHADSAYNRVEV